MAKQLISIRISEATKNKLHELAQPDHYHTQTEAIAVAIDRLHQEDIGTSQPIHMWTTDQATQENWLRNLAGDIATSSGAQSPDMASRAVVNWLDELRKDGDLPSWIGRHDRKLLVEWVSDRL